MPNVSGFLVALNINMAIYINFLGWLIQTDYMLRIVKVIDVSFKKTWKEPAVQIRDLHVSYLLRNKRQLFWVQTKSFYLCYTNELYPL